MIYSMKLAVLLLKQRDGSFKFLIISFFSYIIFMEQPANPHISQTYLGIGRFLRRGYITKRMNFMLQVL
jgi:hypothetical protein